MSKNLCIQEFRNSYQDSKDTNEVVYAKIQRVRDKMTAKAEADGLRDTQLKILLAACLQQIALVHWPMGAALQPLN